MLDQATTRSMKATTLMPASGLRINLNNPGDEEEADDRRRVTPTKSATMPCRDWTRSGQMLAKRTFAAAVAGYAELQRWASTSPRAENSRSSSRAPAAGGAGYREAHLQERAKGH